METNLDLNLDLDYLASEDHISDKANHRRSRKAKLKKTQRHYGASINQCIGKYASAYGKRMLHRYNRRKLEISESDYYKHSDYSYSSICWAIG